MTEFDNIVNHDREREDEVLLPLMQDPRIAKAVLAETVPQLGLDIDVEELLKDVAIDHKRPIEEVREAFERAKNKFERESHYGH